ncbi:hypothetical protein [Candidatus Palauibacter sp.]|uniref:hypothetical protein n=1 Tax=Candidatus Palauibacter sp. TaxID=3101350 RepID=UPI003CC5812A
MKKKLTLPAFALALLVGLSGCDLQVSNPNEPDRGRALASPDDVETLIASTYQKVWAIGHYWDNANFAFNHVSSRHTATWGNNGQNDLGREPREPMPNSTSYRWAYVFYEHWNDAYGGIAAASDGIRAIDEGLEIGPGGERNARARAFAVASQAMLSCLLSLWYDQSFIVDETTDLTGELDTVDYDAMFAYAMGKLDEAESAARAASFSLPDNWINGNAWSNTEFADYLVSWKARCAANLPRTDAEAAGVNWAQVIQNAQNGMRDVVVIGEDRSSDTAWWDGLKSRAQENGTWHRMHMDWIGMADQSGEYQDWLSLPTQSRTPRKLSFGDDRRFPPANVDGTLGESVSPTAASMGPIHRYNANISYIASRGTYRQSHYGDARYDVYTLSCNGCWSGDMEHMTPVEFDHYIAEGHYRMGNFAGAADIINVTRMQAGLPPAPSNPTDPVPSNGAGECTPRKRYDTQGRCGNLRDAIWFEHFENVFNVFGGLEFFHGRRNDILPTGTALQLPMPASDLEVLQRDIYTFGGSAGGGAGNPTPPSIVPGSLDAALERAAFALHRLRAQQKAARANQDLVVR